MAREKRRAAVRMAGKLCLLCLAFVLLCLPAVYMNHIYGYFPVLFALFLLLLSVLCLFLIERGLGVQAKAPDAECERNESVRVQLLVRNGSGLICPRAEASFYVTDLYGEVDSTKRVRLTLAAGKDAKLAFRIRMPHIGIYEVGIRSLRLYDFFGLFSRTVSVRGKAEVYCRPGLRDVDGYAFLTKAMAESSRETNLFVKDGNDYFGVRGYEVGDPLKQIHWKLSARSDNYFTKLYENSREPEYVVFLDFYSEEGYGGETRMEVNDCLIETAYSVLKSFSAAGEDAALVYVNRGRQVRRSFPKNGEIGRELVKDFAMLTGEEDCPDASVMLEEVRGQRRGGRNVVVVTSTAGEKLTGALLDEKAAGSQPSLLLVVSAEKDRKERQDIYDRLDALEEADISFTLVSTASNHGGEAVH